jgi:methyl-accepting chemotaxis protein
MFQKMKVSVRLAIAFGVVLTGFLALVVVGVVTNLRMGAKVERLVNEQYPTIVLTASMRAAVSDFQFALQDIALATDRKQVEARAASLPDLARRMDGDLQRLEQWVQGEDSKSLLGDLRQAGKDYLEARDRFIADAKAQPGGAADAFQGTKNAYLLLSETVGSFVQTQSSVVNDTGEVAARDSRHALWLMALLGGIGLAVAAAIGYTISRGMLRQLGGEPRYAAEIARAIASGGLSVDVLTHKVDTTSLLGAMKRMQVDLKQMIVQVRISADAVSAAAGQMAASAPEAMRASQQQTDAASVATAAVAEMAHSASQVAHSAAETHRNSSDASRLSEEGVALVQQASAEMSKIAQTVEISSQQIQSLMRRADEIGSIVNVIREIADQTNLLALNAAIEAARAGDQGRGFAVVADEVRQLAERTGAATTQITQMISSIQSETRNAVNSMNEGGSLVQNGVRLADRAAQSLETINAEMGETLKQIEEVAVAADAQRKLSDNMAQHMDRIGDVARTARAAITRSAEATDRLESLAAELNAAVSRFRV